MMLYHGTNIDIQTIDLASCRPYKDFGRGFHTTDILEQTQKMTKRVAKIYGRNPVVNMYEAADDYMENMELKILDFGRIPSERWAMFIMNNRNRAL